MVFARHIKRTRHILILNQESEVRPNQSEIAFRMAIEDLSDDNADCLVTTLHYMHANPRFIERDKHVYLEADGCEVNLSNVRLFLHDTRFMDLIDKRMCNER